VLAHGTPLPRPEVQRTPRAAVPVVRAPGGTPLGDGLRDAGLL
jgi:hypothetical protein